MSRIFRDDTQWAIAGTVATTALEQLARQLPKELQADGTKIVAGKDGFAAHLVFGDVPDGTLATQLLSTVTPVYLLDFDDDVPVTLKLDRKKTRVTETRLTEHPADFLDERGIVAPGYAITPSPVSAVGLVEETTTFDAHRAMPDVQVEFRAHPRGVLVVGQGSGLVTGMLSEALERRSYTVFRDRETGRFSCILEEPGQEPASYSPVTPSPNFPPLSNILGETTLDGILRVLAIPRELLGLEADDEDIPRDQQRADPDRS